MLVEDGGKTSGCQRNNTRLSADALKENPYWSNSATIQGTTSKASMEVKRRHLSRRQRGFQKRCAFSESKPMESTHLQTSLPLRLGTPLLPCFLIGWAWDLQTLQSKCSYSNICPYLQIILGTQVHYEM